MLELQPNTSERMGRLKADRHRLMAELKEKVTVKWWQRTGTSPHMTEG